jgi:NAD dependent epimerase/dehydratase family enzyme
MGEILKRPTFFAVPAFVLKTLAREESVLILNSQRVVPEAALKTGYRFRYPDIRSALKNFYGSP